MKPTFVEYQIAFFPFAMVFAPMWSPCLLSQRILGSTIYAAYSIHPHLEGGSVNHAARMKTIVKEAFRTI